MGTHCSFDRHLQLSLLYSVKCNQGEEANAWVSIFFTSACQHYRKVQFDFIKYFFQVFQTKRFNGSFRSSHDELSFQQGINYCITKDFRDGPGSNVMPIGQLRNLKNRFDRHGHRKLRVDFESESDSGEEGPFYVNAVKSPDMEWREYPSGRLIKLEISIFNISLSALKMLNNLLVLKLQIQR